MSEDIIKARKFIAEAVDMCLKDYDKLESYLNKVLTVNVINISDEMVINLEQDIRDIANVSNKKGMSELQISSAILIHLLECAFGKKEAKSIYEDLTDCVQNNTLKPH